MDQAQDVIDNPRKTGKPPISERYFDNRSNLEAFMTYISYV
ncbi:hypothetical protein D1BOALGB6SA_9121 [Olavius sp. associated proteobacterium Delta 1]|nr:hypothetical protein D1BOALGB6SA_9121 [Olavius sp. associated proteobacterium Delta 1]